MEQSLVEQLKEAVILGDPPAAVALAEQIVAEGVDPILAFEEGMRAGITEVGDGFSKGELFLPDLVIAADTMKAAAVILEKEIQRTGAARTSPGKIVIGTVAGDLHDIGKTIVGTMLNSHGFEVIDLGVNVSVQGFVDAVKEHKPVIVGLSSLLTVTAKEIARVISALGEQGLRGDVKVLAGGGAVTEDYIEEIGGDGYGHDAEIAVRVAKSLLGMEG